MPQHKGPQIEGQGQLMGPEMVPFPVDVGRRRSVAKLLTPDFLGMNLNDYQDISLEAREMAAPENLRPALIGVSEHNVNSVSYMSDKRKRVTIAVTPEEHGLVARNVQALGSAAMIKTLQSRPHESRFAPHNAAAERSAIHAFENKFNRMEQYFKNVLLPRRELLAGFEKNSRHGNVDHALFKNEGVMRQDFETLRSGILGGALLSIRLQRGLNPDEADQMERAIMKRIVLDRQSNQHLQNFRGLLRLLDEHNSLKLDLFRAQAWELKRRLNTHD